MKDRMVLIGVMNEIDTKKYVVFISHASEDRDAIVRPLATELEWLTVRVCLRLKNA